MRPVSASLHVHLDNGETFKATDEDMAKFGYVKNFNAYTAWEDRIRNTINQDLTESPINPLRYLLEVVLFYPNHFEDFSEDMQVTLNQIKDINNFLIEHGYENSYPEDENK